MRFDNSISHNEIFLFFILMGDHFLFNRLYDFSVIIPRCYNDIFGADYVREIGSLLGHVVFPKTIQF